MKRIDLPVSKKKFNKEKILRFAQNLKNKFTNVQINFYKADIPVLLAVSKPKNIVRSAKENANYIVINIKGKKALEFYGSDSRAIGNIFDENLSKNEILKINELLFKSGLQNPYSGAEHLAKIPIFEKVESYEKTGKRPVFRYRKWVKYIFLLAFIVLLIVSVLDIRIIALALLFLALFIIYSLRRDVLF